MTACDADLESLPMDADHGALRMEEAWARLLHLESQVRELRRLLQADPDGADQAGAAGWPAPDDHAPPGRSVAPHEPLRLRPAGAALTLQGAAVDSGAPTGQDGVWQVVCLGPFRLYCAGREQPSCSSRRGWGILQFLLTRPGFAATRDALIEAFWPESAPSAGAHNLQMAVLALRRALRGFGPGGSNEVVLYRDGQYLLNPGLTIDVDVHHFRAACERGRRLAAGGQHEAARRAFEEALRLYGGPFLHDSGYDEWAEPHRVALQELQLGVLGWLGDAYATLGQWESAAASFREILAADPYREDAIRQLLRCLAATSRHAELERTYRSCRARIWRDLQVEPAPETVRVYRQLTEGAGAPDARLGQPVAVRG